MHVCTCISKGRAEGKRGARLQLDHKKFSTMKTETIVYNEHENSKYQTLENKLPEMGCQFQFSVEHHITKELLFKNKKGLRGKKTKQKDLNC